MVRGLALFKHFFLEFSDQYTLIGGAACTLWMKRAGMDFRNTKDLDIVLHIEALKSTFVTAFWQFIEEGGYSHRNKSTDRNIFYRFSHPTNPEYPAMLELFSRAPDGVQLKSAGHLTPIPTDESIASLSAILMDNDYYSFLNTGKLDLEGLPVLAITHLIPLKARAWLDLNERKRQGGPVDERDIRKHRNDLFRLAGLLSGGKRVPLPQGIQQDIQCFLSSVHLDPSVNLKALGIRNFTLENILDTLQSTYLLDSKQFQPSAAGSANT